MSLRNQITISEHIQNNAMRKIHAGMGRGNSVSTYLDTESSTDHSKGVKLFFTTTAVTPVLSIDFGEKTALLKRKKNSFALWVDHIISRLIYLFGPSFLIIRLFCCHHKFGSL